MFAFNLLISLLLAVYVSGPLFISHLLWLLASAWWTEIPVAILFQGIVVVKDDISLPHPPGFFSPFDSSANNGSESTLDDSCCTSFADDSTMSATLGVSAILPVQVISSDDEYSTASGDVLTASVLEPAQQLVDDSPREKPPSPLRRSLTNQVILRFGKRSLPGRVHKTSTSSPVTSPENPASVTFRRVSAVWNRKKEGPRQQDDAVGLGTKFQMKLASIKNTKFF